MECLNIHDGDCLEYQVFEESCAKGCRELFLHEHWLEILGIHPGVATIPLFGVDVPASSECIRLSIKFSRVEMNDQVKLRQKLRPPGLLAGEHLTGGKILQILVVSDHING